MERGQASIEWLGVVALVALVLGGIGLATGGAAIGAAVVRQIHHALCVVRGGVCDLDRRACVREATAVEDGQGVTIGFVHLGGKTLTLYEHLSDGTVLITELTDVGAGAKLEADLSKVSTAILAGGAARISVIASLGGGTTWAFADKNAADDGSFWIGQGKAPPQGRVVSRITQSGIDVELGVDAEHQSGGSLGLALRARGSDGHHVDPETGRRTHVVRRSLGGQALIALPEERASAGGGGSVEERLSVTTAEDGSPLELSVVRTRDLHGAYELPETIQPIATELTGGDAGHRRWVVEQRLDLTDPTNLAAAEEMLQALDGPVPYLARATDRLRARLAEAGVTEARVYDVARSDDGIAVDVGLGSKLSFDADYGHERAVLTDARLKGPDGIWRDAPACPVG